MLSFSDESVSYCVKALLRGELVAFPTETVYGLGGNALDDKALEKIFHAKGRPKSDPLIVHINSMVQAESLTEMTSFQRQCFDILGEAFWPGPLTLIVNASKNISKLITAGGNAIALRIPIGEVAQSLLKQSQLPLAAPSANRFGHVSPTKAQHVLDDLGDYPNLFILDNNQSCDIGIESTVVKISEKKSLSILRPGAISSLQIKKVLQDKGVSVEVKIIKREIKISNIGEHLSSGMEAPGQLLTHYAPSLEAFIVQKKELIDKNSQLFSSDIFKDAVMIDFNASHKNLGKLFLKYFDLSESGNPQEASRNLFQFLREAESIKNAKYILLPNLMSENNEELNAIFDRIFRAASGKYVQIN
ncbi:threonylcarbamoyl-AMP synthase [Silvanigrella aquatica]|uniref:Threonylcarbamoyl-AMP synthase n=1 Tax=Silvanigrella aquatica TaxID=1915309 RepID=A0A1L4D499_9BACT|nr:threonylcarbamoyl-AMP synthase [Silvanigrella aquatica]